ncbi:ribosome-associated protein L7Ae-like [Paenibacillus faecis]|uniref:50S ribosomal protein L7ae-like protein n=1 Tax=Paenibacillus faecis TaxID=862114 RepID=A0A5D0CL25_9BACL|nr:MULTISPECIES: ribosomal L7Ae/L30e/S12e/Gadd45 family protein [Paenibacillus]MCA1296188.1 ribosomal L7Ae/L30e/S12e/Gadd45 family protein [Paenibacillus sp. alder61]TYA09864.1 50S ribosomal protein L7ae-like protein [Paenibacillus faecis]GIO88351.1 ribosome-associated protein L7Ae-like [Paenibacillus faecis]
MSNDKGLQDAHVKIGTKQTMRMVELGRADEVYVAEDADPRLTSKIIALCNQRSVKVTMVDTMVNLGKACGIDVGAAMAAIVRQ